MTVHKAILIFLVAMAAPPYSAAQSVVEQRSGDDLYSAGMSVQVVRPVDGDAVLAGGSVLVTEGVGQDVLAAGGTVTITGRVADDLRAAGGTVTVTRGTGGDAILAGGTVTLAPGSVVDGNAWTAGGVLHLESTVGGDVRAAGGEVVIGGRVAGDADVVAESLSVRPGTVITGTLHYRGPQPADIAADAQIGEVVYTEGTGFERPISSYIGGLFASLLFFLCLAISTLIYLWLLPGVSREAADNTWHRLLLSLGVGVLTVIVTPIVGTLGFALLVTAPLAVIVFALYIAVLAAGALTVMACLGAWLRQRFWAARGEGVGMQIASVLVAAVLLWLVGLIPFIGAVVVLLAFTTGAGGLILLLGRLYKKPLQT